MSRSIRMIGLTVLSSLAAVASLASTAQASSFMSEGNTSMAVRGRQLESEKFVFTMEGNKVECSTFNFETEGEMVSPSETLEVHPTVSGCQAFGFVEVTVATTGCNFVLHAGPKAAGVFEGSGDLACSGENKIVITAATCQATVGSQSVASGFKFTNNASGTLTLRVNASGITATKTKDGFLCPFSGTGTISTATYTGGAEIAAIHETSTIAITME